MSIFDKDKWQQAAQNFGNGVGSVLGKMSQGMSDYVARERAKDQKPEWNDPGKGEDMQRVYDSIMNRKDFQFDLNGNALYQQLRQSYDKQGQLGAMGAVGAAAAQTGGYGNSYAAAAGQQAYQQSLENLNDRIPDLYQMALAQYQAQGEKLMQQYQVGDNDRAFQYQVYRDDVGDWRDQRNFDYQKQRDKVADSQWSSEMAQRDSEFNQNMKYQKERAAAADAQWQQQFDYTAQQDELNRQERYERYGVEDSHWNAEWENKLKQQAIENEHWDKTNEQTERFHQDDLALSYAGLNQDNEHFYATIDQNAAFHKDDMDLSYAKLGQENSQFWATYGQNENFHQDDLKQQGIENTIAQAYLDLAIGDSKWGQKMDIEDLKKAYLAMGLKYG